MRLPLAGKALTLTLLMSAPLSNARSRRTSSVPRESIPLQQYCQPEAVQRRDMPRAATVKAALAGYCQQARHTVIIADNLKISPVRRPRCFLRCQVERHPPGIKVFHVEILNPQQIIAGAGRDYATSRSAR